MRKAKSYYSFWYTYHQGFRRETEKAIALEYDEGNGREAVRWIPKSIILWGPVNSCGNQFFYVPKWFFFRNHYDINRFDWDSEVEFSELSEDDINGESYVEYKGEDVVIFEKGTDGSIPQGDPFDKIGNFEICFVPYSHKYIFAREI